jgi:hypothetical protein
MPWLSTLPRFLMFFIASVLVLKEWIEVLARNALSTSETMVYILPDSVVVGAISLGVVGLSIFLKRNIWAYLFFLAIIASFFPMLTFTQFNFFLYIGSIELNMVAITMLVSHVLLNVHLIRVPDLSEKEKEESNEGQVSFFMKNFESKSDDELIQLDESDLLPQAREARKRLLEKRGL